MVRNMDFAMMSQFFKHTLSLPLSFFAKRKTGDIFARFQENQTIRAFSDRIHGDDRAEPADGVHLLHHHVLLQREADACC